MSDPLYVVIATSCTSCNVQSVRLLSHKPTQEELDAVATVAGGGYCVRVKYAEVVVDGEAVEGSYDE